VIRKQTGCVFGGALTALCYPEMEFVSIKAKQTHCEPARPLLADERKSPSLSTQHQYDDLLDLADVTGKRIVSTRLHHNVRFPPPPLVNQTTGGHGWPSLSRLERGRAGLFMRGGID
jgi:hypothetical protein